MRSVSDPIEPAGDIHVNIASFARSLRATNLSPRTIQSYAESTRLLAQFLTEQGMPTSVVAIQREHLEAFISSVLQRWKPATAHNRYRGCQAFFRWLVEEGEITVSPFAKMKPPQIPEAPAPVLDDAQVKALVAATSARRRSRCRRRGQHLPAHCFETWPCGREASTLSDREARELQLG